MAAGKFNMQKASGGVASITVADGVGATNIVLPESGTVATTSNIVGFKNYIINGGFDIWQRGTAVVPSLDTATLIADRFFVVLSGAQKNVQRVVLYENYNNKYGLSINGSNISSNTYIITRLEAINTHKLHGKTATLSCKVFATNAGSMAINIDRPIAVDTYTATTTIHSENIVLTAGVNTISFSVTFNEVDPTYGLQAAFIYGALGPNDNRVLADVQLEEGSVATPFENLSYALQYEQCRRYYRRYATQQNVNDLAYKMRTTPTESGTAPYTYSAEL